MKRVDEVLAMASKMAVQRALHFGEENDTANFAAKPVAVSPASKTAGSQQPEHAGSPPDSIRNDATDHAIAEPKLPALVPSATSRTALPKKRFTRRSLDEVVNERKPESAVHNLLPAKGVATIYGYTGSGKSLLCLHLADALARGLPWFGHIVPKKLRVVYVVLEGQGGMPARAQALKESQE